MNELVKGLCVHILILNKALVNNWACLVNTYHQLIVHALMYLNDCYTHYAAVYTLVMEKISLL